MANELPPNAAAEADKIKEQNAQVARDLENQGRPNTDDDSRAMDDTRGALDALRDAMHKEDDDGQSDDDPAAGGAGSGEGDASGAGGVGTDDGQPAGDAGKASDKREGSDDGQPVVEPKDDDKTPAPADKGTPAPAPDEDIFKEHKLPDTATPKSSEAFEGVKTRAREEIAKLSTTITELNNQIAELKQKTEGVEPITDELRAEIQQLREFKAKIDIDSDPQFKESNEAVDSTREFIYAQLKKGGLGDETIKAIKEFGGPDKVDMGPILEAVKDTAARRTVDGALTDLERRLFDINKRKEAARENISEYLKQQEEAFQKGATAHQEATKKVWDSFAPKLDFLQPVKLKANATEEDKKLAAAQDEFLKTVNGEIQQALSDDSPEMRATLIAGVVKLFHQDRLLQGQQALLGRKDEQIKALTKERDEAKALAEKLTKGSISRLDAAQVSSGVTPRVPTEIDVNLDTNSALEKIRRDIAEKRRASQM